MNKTEIASLLKQPDFLEIYQKADQIRKKTVGDEIKIRAILEFSNYCRRQCAYCGLRAPNLTAKRYRMEPGEIIKTANLAAEAGYKTIVLQSGEDPFYTPEILGEIVTEIKKSGIDITLSCGEMSFKAYAYLKACGADRYLLKHETADPALYERLHPCGTLSERIRCLRDIKKLGFDTGSGFMIGLPGQTEETIAEDIALLCDLKCDMAGIGPFIPHPETPLKDKTHGSTELTKRAVAITRILLPKAHLPATTSLGVLDLNEKNSVFNCGANVVMKKVTPKDYLELYEIYPSGIKPTDIKTGLLELKKQITDIGRIPD